MLLPNNIVLVYQLGRLYKDKKFAKTFWTNVCLYIRKLKTYTLVRDSESALTTNLIKNAIVYTLVDYNCFLNHLDQEEDFNSVLNSEEFDNLMEINADVLIFYTLALTLDGEKKKWYRLLPIKKYMELLFNEKLSKNYYFKEQAILFKAMNNVLISIDKLDMDLQDCENQYEICNHYYVAGKQYQFEQTEDYKEYQKELAYED